MFSLPNVYYLELHLRFEVVGEQGKAKFDGKRKVLRVNLPVVQPAEQETAVEEGEVAPITPENPIETLTPKEENPTSDPPAPSFLTIYQPVEEPKAEIEVAESQSLPEVQIRPSPSLPDPIESLPSPSIEELPSTVSTSSPKLPIQPVKPSVEVNEPVFDFNQDSSAVAHVLFHVPGLQVSSLHSSLYRNGFRAEWISETKTETRKTAFSFQFFCLINLKNSSISGIIDYVIVKLTKTIPEPWTEAGHFVQDFEGLVEEEEQPIVPEALVAVSEPEVTSETGKPAVFSYIAFETPLLYELV